MSVTVGAAPETTVEMTLDDRVFGAGRYRYLPFDVPAGVTRLDVALASHRSASVGIALFDAQGCGAYSPGFRGISGSERRHVFVAPEAATPGFTPGPIDPGTWTLVVPVFVAPLPTRVSARIRLTFGPAAACRRPEPLQTPVTSRPGWYRGDLHCHTEASSDAWASGSPLTPAGWAEVARSLGLDFLAMTDHNVVSQNWTLARDAGDDVLLLAGEEMTNYLHGHATVSGLDIGQWLDFRQTPFGWRLPRGGSRIADFVATARGMGAYVSAAHPLAGWQFLLEEIRNPAARPDGYEVWNGPWGVREELALAVWNRQLRAGWDVVANGGSDLHGTDNTEGYRAGLPTTVVYAQALARDDIVAALRAGRSFVTASPDGVEVYLTASGPRGQSTFVGGRLRGSAADVVDVEVLVRGGGGGRLRLVTRDGVEVEAPLESDEQTLAWRTTIGAGYVRAEVRGRGPRPRKGTMEAFTNPIRFVEGEPPDVAVPELGPPPPRRR